MNKFITFIRFCNWFLYNLNSFTRQYSKQSRVKYDRGKYWMEYGLKRRKNFYWFENFSTLLIRQLLTSIRKKQFEIVVALISHLPFGVSFRLLLLLFFFFIFQFLFLLQLFNEIVIESLISMRQNQFLIQFVHSNGNYESLKVSIKITKI